MSRMTMVLDEVSDERVKQDAKWGPQNWTDLGWEAIENEEKGEASKEVVELSFTVDPKYHDYKVLALRKELIQLAAVAVAHIEAIDRRLKDGVVPESPDERFMAIRAARRAENATASL